MGAFPELAGGKVLPRGFRMKELKNKTVVVAFTNGTLDTCVVLDIDYKLHFIKFCYADDPETVFWRNLSEVSSINLAPITTP